MNKIGLLLSLIYLSSISNSLYAEDCSTVLSLSGTSAGQSLNKSSFESRASKFCDEYSKLKKQGKQQSLGVKYMDIGVSASGGSSSVDSVHSKYCKSDDSKSVSSLAYQAFSNSIAPGGFKAYEACLASKAEGLNYKVVSALEKSAAILLGYKSDIAKVHAEMGVAGEGGIDCSIKKFEGSINESRFVLDKDNTVKVTCTRTSSQFPGDIVFTRYNTGAANSSISIPWSAYQGGIPVSLVTQYEDAVSTHNDLASRIESLEKNLNSQKGIDQVQDQSINNIKKPKNCKWVGITNQKGGHSAGTKGKLWTGKCPNGSYAKSYRLKTWESDATYQHAIQCCQL